MKKIVLIFVAILLAASLCACGETYSSDGLNPNIIETTKADDESENFQKCDECGELCRDETLTYIEVYDLSVCQGCLDAFSECEVCSVYYRNDDLFEQVHGGPICASCAEDYYQCSSCGLYEEDGCGDDLSDEELCCACAMPKTGKTPAPPAYYGDLQSDTSDDEESQTVYITEGGAKYHQEGCQYLSKSKISISLNEAKSQGYSACSKCW